MPYPEPLPTLGPMTTPGPLPTPAPLPPPPVVYEPLPPMSTMPPQNPVVDIDGGSLLFGGTVATVAWLLIKFGGAFFTHGLTLAFP